MSEWATAAKHRHCNIMWSAPIRVVSRDVPSKSQTRLVICYHAPAHQLHWCTAPGMDVWDVSRLTFAYTGMRTGKNWPECMLYTNYESYSLFRVDFGSTQWRASGI